MKNMTHLEQLIEKAEKTYESKTAFRKYAEKLKGEIKAGKISPEDYRELIMKWSLNKFGK